MILTETSLQLFGPVVGEAIFETVVAALIRGRLSGVLLASGPFVAENFIADDGVDFLPNR